MRFSSGLAIPVVAVLTACATATPPTKPAPPAAVVARQTQNAPPRSRNAVANYPEGIHAFSLSAESRIESGAFRTTSILRARIEMSVESSDSMTVFRVRADSLALQPGFAGLVRQPLLFEIVARATTVEFKVPEGQDSATACMTNRIVLNLLPSIYHIVSGFPNAASWRDSTVIATCVEGTALTSAVRRSFDYRPIGSSGMFEIQLSEMATGAGGGPVLQHNLMITSEGKGSAVLNFDEKGFSGSHAERNSDLSITASGRTTKVLQTTSVELVRRD